MPKLFIRLLGPAIRHDEGFLIEAAWLIQEDNGQIRAKGETDFRGLSELVDPTTDWIRQPNNIVVTVPSEHVLSLSCSVPGRSTGQVRRALPFVVEEFVSTDIDDLHLATGELSRRAPVRCNLVEHRLLVDWLDCLAALDIRPGFLFSEAELLPVADGEATLLLDGPLVLLRTADQALALDRDNLLLALSALDVSRIRVVYGALSELEAGQLDPEVELDVTEAETGDAPSSLAYLASRSVEDGNINLLQGRYLARQPRNPVWQRWNQAAALAAVWIGLVFVTMIAEALYANHRADGLEASSVALYRNIFPAEQRIINVRRQMQAKLGDRGDAGSGFIGYLGDLSAAMDESARIMSLSYTDDRRELAVDLTVPGFEAVEQLKGNLETRGVVVEITSAEQQTDAVRARLRIRSPGAGS